jgi:esterase/lipase superfamily enzyme
MFGSIGGGGGSSPPPFTRLEVEFATNRAEAGRAPNVTFTGARGDLKFGAAVVTIPFTHREGEVELPPWYDPFAANPAHHFTVENVRILSGGDWGKEVRSAAQRSGTNAVFLFVHGYNNSFQDALFRTAQIAYDVHFKGAVAMFDWPSVHQLTGYMKDYSNAEWSISDFKAAFRRVLAATHSNEIYIIAHSMGNQVVTRGLVEIAAEDPSVRGRIRELVLAAPDIDAATFKRDIAPFLSRAAKHTTLYASSKDYALSASRKLQGYSRAGDTRNGITIVPPIDSVDASRASKDFLGHSYVADDIGILHDISEIFMRHLPPAQRGLEARRGREGAYWVYTGN